MRTSIMNPIGYLLLRWRSVVALLGGILAAMAMLFFALSVQSGAQTTGPVQAIAAGDKHALAIVNDPISGPGTVYAWGNNYYGQIGDGTRLNDRFPPQRVMGPGGVGDFTGMKAIDGGFGHSLAVKSTDGSVWGWGDNGGGALGNGEEFTVRTTPVRSGNIIGVTDVAAGSGHSLALKSDGTVYAWGMNNYGQLGVGGDNSDRLTPVRVKGVGGVGDLTDVKAIAAGHNHSLFLKNDGTVYAVGGTNNGQLGIGDTTGTRDTLVQVKGTSVSGEPFLTDVVAIAAGAYHSMAVKSDGTVYAWGAGDYGQLGLNSNNDHSIPYQVHGVGNGQPPLNGLSGISDVAAGEHHSMALKSDGTAVYAWGGNNNGQLGIGNKDDHQVPYQVHGLNNGQPPDNGLSGVTDVAAGEHFSMALKSDGTAVYAWGANQDDQIDASNNDRTYPVQVGGIPGATPPEPTGEKTAICHKSGTPHAKTLYVPEKALKGHLGHGDELGACE